RTPIGRIVGAVVGTLLGNPRGFLRAAGATLKFMRKTYRPRVYHLIYLAEACVVARWAETADHIHAHFGTNSAEVAMLANLITGIPFSFTIHGPEEFDRPEFLSLATKIRHASFVCAISSFTRSQLYRWCPQEDWPKIHLVR